MKKGLPYILAAAVLFSSTEVAVKATGGVFNPIQLNFIRFLIGGLILLPTALKKLKEADYKLSKSDFITFTWTGFACVIISMTLYILSISFVPASVAAILYSCNPFFSIILAAIFLKEDMNKFIAGGLVACFVGVLMIINPLHFTGSVVGIVIGLSSAFTFAIYSVLGKVATKGKPTSGLVLTSFTFIFGAIELGLLMSLTHIESISNFMLSKNLDVFSKIPYLSGISTSNIVMLLIISILITGIGFAFYFMAMDKTNVTMASLVFFIKPVLSPIIAYFFLGDVPKTNMIIGICFIVAGSMVIFRTNMKALEKSEKEKSSAVQQNASMTM